jgi:hypothetical protein
MAWGELGGTYGRKLYEKRDKDYLAAAITVKLLLGFDAAYSNLTDFDYLVPSNDTLIVNSATGEYGHSLSDGENTLGKPFRIRGYGGGFDIGFTYYRGRVHGAGDCNQTAEIRKKYNYRLGLSLIDFGVVHFSNNAKVFSFDNSSTLWPGIDTVKFNSIMALDTAISNHFYGDPYQSQSASSFSIFTPAAVSLQFDYCVMPKIYVNATWVQATPLNDMSVVRASQFSITPRYETRKFEAALPFTVYEYKHPHLGVAVRYLYFVLGTDRLGSFTGLWDTTGYDLYFGIKFNACELRKKGGKQPFCPAYSK